MNVKPDFKMLNKRVHQFNKTKALVPTICKKCKFLIDDGEEKYTHVVRNGYNSLEYIEPLCVNCGESHEEFVVEENKW